MPTHAFSCLNQDVQDEQDFQDEESPVVGNLFPCRSDLPVAMFTGRALNKRCVPHPVNPVNPANPASEQLIAIRLQTTCLGLRREVAGAFRRCSASRKRGNVPKHRTRCPLTITDGIQFRIVIPRLSLGGRLGPVVLPTPMPFPNLSSLLENVLGSSLPRRGLCKP